MQAVWQNIWAGLTTASLLDQVNLGLGLVGVVLMVRQSLWAFPVGLAAVSVQGVLFWRSHFPADALLQGFFFVTLAWGWWHWLKDKRAAPELPVTRLSARGWAVTLVAAGCGTVVWARWVGPALQAAMPWRDAFIAAFSVAAQVLQVRKNIENWPFWLVVNIVAATSYWSAELAYTAFLYAVYLVLAALGWREWTRTMRKAVT